MSDPAKEAAASVVSPSGPVASDVPAHHDSASPTTNSTSLKRPREDDATGDIASPPKTEATPINGNDRHRSPIAAKASSSKMSPTLDFSASSPTARRTSSSTSRPSSDGAHAAVKPRGSSASPEIASKLVTGAQADARPKAHGNRRKEATVEPSHDGDGMQSSKDDEEGDGNLKRFQCHLCDRAFARAYNLNTHLSTHDPDPNRAKPFPCPYPSCRADGGRSFSRKHDLQRHVASNHENEPEPADVGETDEQGNRIKGLASLGLGTPGRKFRCDECGRAFVRRDALKRHQCVPTGSPHSSSGGAATGGASTAGRVASPSTPRSTFDTAPDSPFLGPAPSGVSLYTSTGTHPTGSSSSSSSVAQRYSNGLASTYDANAPFYPSGVTYETLTREVDDVAEQLVAQATSYNNRPGDGSKGERHSRA